MSRTPKKTVQQKSAVATPVSQKYSLAAAADACDEAAGRINVVLRMLDEDEKDTGGYETLMIVEALEAIRDQCLKGSKEYSKALDAKGGA